MESSSYDSLEYIVDGQIYGLNLKTHDEKCQGDEELLQVISSFKPQGSISYLFIQFVELPEITSSVNRQKSKSQNGCYKKTKHTKFSEKRTFLTL